MSLGIDKKLSILELFSACHTHLCDCEAEIDLFLILGFPILTRTGRLSYDTFLKLLRIVNHQNFCKLTAEPFLTELRINLNSHSAGVRTDEKSSRIQIAPEKKETLDILFIVSD